MSQKEQLLTEKEAAAYLGVKPRTLSLYRKTRRVPHYQLTPKTIRYKRSDLLQWMASYSSAKD